MRTGDAPSLHYLATRRTEYHRIGNRVLWKGLRLRLGLCSLVKIGCLTNRRVV